jgi:hypothetical protein
MRTFQDRVRRRLWQRLKGLPALLANEGGANLVECLERAPAGPGDFPIALQNQRLDNGVLLELWARVDSTSTDDDKPAFEAQVQWMSFPVSRSKEVSLTNGGFFAMPARLAMSESTRAIDSLLVPQRLLVAHVLLSSGVAELAAKHYGSAYRRLSKARTQLCADDVELAKAIDGWIEQTLELAKAAGKPLIGAALAGVGKGGCP